MVNERLSELTIIKFFNDLGFQLDYDLIIQDFNYLAKRRLSLISYCFFVNVLINLKIKINLKIAKLS